MAFLTLMAIGNHQWVWGALVMELSVTLEIMVLIYAHGKHMYWPYIFLLWSGRLYLCNVFLDPRQYWHFYWWHLSMMCEVRYFCVHMCMTLFYNCCDQYFHYICWQVYIDDALNERWWVDCSWCKCLVENIVTAFGTKQPAAHLIPSDNTLGK